MGLGPRCKRPTGFEPVTRAWKALVLPLHHGRGVRARLAGRAPGPLCVVVEPRGSRRDLDHDRGVRARAAPAARLSLADRLLRGLDAAAPRSHDHPARDDRAQLSPHDPPAPERRPGRVGACAARPRHPACARRDAAARTPDRRRSLLWVVNYGVWHLPWVYDAALRNPHTLLHLEHALYFATGVLLWWPVVHGAHSPGFKAGYLFAAFVLASPIGLLLALIPEPIYDFYVEAPEELWGLGAARRSADRGRDDVARAGGDLLRGVRLLLRAIPAGAGHPRRAARRRDLIGTAGFEPAASRSQSERATRLRYVPPREV